MLEASMFFKLRATRSGAMVSRMVMRFFTPKAEVLRWERGPLGPRKSPPMLMGFNPGFFGA